MTTLTHWLVMAACGAPLCALAATVDSPKLTRKIVRAQDGLNLVCEVGGQGKVALLFLHGWCGDRAYWKHQVHVFSPDYRMVTMDQAGHGESGKERNEWSVAGLAQDVASVVTTLDLNRVIIIGHSMGAPVGLAAAKRMPGRIIALVGVDTLQNVEFKMREELAKQFLEGFTADFQGTLRTMFAGLLPEAADPELKHWISSRAAAQDQKMALGLMRDMTRLDLQTWLAEAQVPVRCINSSGGYQFFNPTAAENNRKYADYKAVFIDAVGHYPMLEKPAEFNEKLRDVLKELAGK